MLNGTTCNMISALQNDLRTSSHVHRLPRGDRSAKSPHYCRRHSGGNWIRHLSPKRVLLSAAEARLSSGELVEQFSIAREAEETATEAADALLRLLSGASLLTAVCLELTAAWRQTRPLQAANVQWQHQHQYQQQSAHRLVEAAPLPQLQAAGSYVLQRGSLWAVLLAMLCSSVLGRLRRARSWPLPVCFRSPWNH